MWRHSLVCLFNLIWWRPPGKSKTLADKPHGPIPPALWSAGSSISGKCRTPVELPHFQTLTFLLGILYLTPILWSGLLDLLRAHWWPRLHALHKVFTENNRPFPIFRSKNPRGLPFYFPFPFIFALSFIFYIIPFQLLFILFPQLAWVDSFRSIFQSLHPCLRSRSFYRDFLSRVFFYVFFVHPTISLHFQKLIQAFNHLDICSRYRYFIKKFCLKTVQRLGLVAQMCWLWS